MMLNKNIFAIAAGVMIFSVSCFAGAEIPSMEDAVQMEITIDPENPIATVLQGYYSVQLKNADDTTRPVYHYIPEGLSIRQPVVGIGVPSGEDFENFAEDTGWKSLADDMRFSLVMMTADEDGWSYDDVEYVKAALAYMNGRQYVQTQNSAVYAVGYGDSAEAVMAGIVAKSEILAGGAAFGLDAFDVSVLEMAAEQESPQPGLMRSEIAP